MQHVEYYISDDGHKFSNEWECLQYERGCFNYNEIHAYNGIGLPVDLREESTAQVCYLWCETDESARIFDNICQRDDVCSPWDGSWGSAEEKEPHSGRWFWNGEWESYDEWKDSLLQQIADKERIFNGEVREND